MSDLRTPSPCTRAPPRSISRWSPSISLPGDEVIVPAMTFASTANAVMHAGARPVLPTSTAETMCLTPDETERRITERTRAVDPGRISPAALPDRGDRRARADSRPRGDRGLRPCDRDARRSDAMPARSADFGAFSFYVTKNVVTGEGGMVTTDSEAHAARIKRLALHGLSADAWKRFSDEGFKHYEVVEPGFKYNMTDLQAALGLHQLARVEANLGGARQIWAQYDGRSPISRSFCPAPEAPGTRHARHLYTFLLDLDRLDGEPRRGPRSRSTSRKSEPASTTGPPPSPLLPRRVRLPAREIFRTPSGSPSGRSRCRCRRSWRTRTSRVSSPPSSERWRTWQCKRPRRP